MSDGQRVHALSSDDAVSSVVGTVLILAITVAAFGGLAMKVLDEVESDGRSPIADIQIKEGAGGIIVQHRGGESIDASTVSIVIFTNKGKVTCALSQIEGPGTDGKWDIGETVRLGDIYQKAPGETITGLQVVYKAGQTSILGNSGTRAIGTGTPGTCVAAGTGGGGGGGSGPLPDLTVQKVSVANQKMIIQGQSIKLVATIANQGTAASSVGQTYFQVFEGATEVWSSHGASTPTVGASPATVQVTSATAWTPGSAAITWRVTTDYGGTIAESDETNNVRTLSTPFTPAAPGSSTLAFVDKDGDGSFTPGVDEATQFGTLSGGACNGCYGVEVTTPGHGLVIPPTSAGSQKGGTDMYFGAPGNVIMDGSMSTTGGGDMNFTSTGGSVSMGGQAVTNGGGDIHIFAVGDIDATDAVIESNGFKSVAWLKSSAGDIRADQARVAARTIKFEAPSEADGGDIFQANLSLCKLLEDDKSGCKDEDTTANNVNGSKTTGPLAEKSASWT